MKATSPVSAYTLAPYVAYADQRISFPDGEILRECTALHKFRLLPFRITEDPNGPGRYWLPRLLSHLPPSLISLTLELDAKTVVASGGAKRIGIEYIKDLLMTRFPALQHLKFVIMGSSDHEMSVVEDAITEAFPRADANSRPRQNGNPSFKMKVHNVWK